MTIDGQHTAVGQLEKVGGEAPEPCPAGFAPGQASIVRADLMEEVARLDAASQEAEKAAAAQPGKDRFEEVHAGIGGDLPRLFP